MADVIHYWLVYLVQGSAYLPFVQVLCMHTIGYSEYNDKSPIEAATSE